VMCFSVSTGLERFISHICLYWFM